MEERVILTDYFDNSIGAGSKKESECKQGIQEANMVLLPFMKPFSLNPGQLGCGLIVVGCSRGVLGNIPARPHRPRTTAFTSPVSLACRIHLSQLTL